MKSWNICGAERWSSWESPEPIQQRSDLRKTIRVRPLPIAEGNYYGTRLSTVLLIERDTGKVLFVERDIWMKVEESGGVRLGSKEDQRIFRFTIGEH